MNGPAPVLSPDGSALAYATGGEGSAGWILTLYTMRDGQSRALQGTESATSVFFSPDGTRIGFVRAGRIHVVALNGGPPEQLCDAVATGGSGASWGADNWIVFSAVGGLWRVSAAGCQVERVTTLAPEERDHLFPQVLPGGKAAVFTVLSTSGAAKDMAVAVVPLPRGDHKVLVKGASNPHFSPTGHLLYQRDGSLLAVPFDRAKFVLSSTPIVIAPKIQVIPSTLMGRFDVAADGTLVYFPGELDVERSLVWSDRKGALTPIPGPPRPYAHPALLPNGDLIVEIETTPHNLWRYDSATGAMTLLTAKAANHRAVVSPDGRTMVYGSDRGEARSLWRQPTDGGGIAEPIASSPYPRNVSSWSHDGKWLAITQLGPKTQNDVWVMALADLKAREFVATPFAESVVVFSPDSRWIAYQSDESGRVEIVVAAFPGPGPRKQVSTGGGDLPLFADDGRTLYVQARRAHHGRGVQRRADTDARRAHGRLRRARRAGPLGGDAAAGQRGRQPGITTVRQSAAGTHVSMHVVVNWFEELRRLSAAP